KHSHPTLHYFPTRRSSDLDCSLFIPAGIRSTYRKQRVLLPSRCKSISNRMATCMIVEDEPLSQELLQSYIAQVRELELVATCGRDRKSTRLNSSHSQISYA